MINVGLSGMTARYYNQSGATAAYYGSTQVWSSEPDYKQMYFTMEFIEDGDFSIAKSGFECRKNGGEWTGISENQSINVLSGDTFEFRSDNTLIKTALFSGTTKFNVYGNIMSLTHSSDFANAQQTTPYEHQKTLAGTYVINAENLIFPEGTIQQRGLEDFFRDCYYLTKAPKEIPATILGEGCMSHMFTNCSAMTTTPLLYATFLSGASLNGTFVNCSSITDIEFKNILNTIVSTSCHYCFDGCPNFEQIKIYVAPSLKSIRPGNWMPGVKATGYFYTNKTEVWLKGTGGIPSGWTVMQ